MSRSMPDTLIGVTVDTDALHVDLWTVTADAMNRR